jgi:hypothetical protein
MATTPTGANQTEQGNNYVKNFNKAIRFRPNPNDLRLLTGAVH